MSAEIDAAVLDFWKRYLANPVLRDLIAPATTLQEVERLLAPHLGGENKVRERTDRLREFAQDEASDRTAAEIVREAGR